MPLHFAEVQYILYPSIIALLTELIFHHQAPWHNTIIDELHNTIVIVFVEINQTKQLIVVITPSFERLLDVTN